MSIVISTQASALPKKRTWKYILRLNDFASMNSAASISIAMHGVIINDTNSSYFSAVTAASSAVI